MKADIGKAKQNLQKTKNQVFAQTATLINGAFALIAALAWNEAIKALIDRYVPAGSSLYSKFLYALVLTTIVVLISMKLTKIIDQYHKDEPDTK